MTLPPPKTPVSVLRWPTPRAHSDGPAQPYQARGARGDDAIDFAPDIDPLGVPRAVESASTIPPLHPPPKPQAAERLDPRSPLFRERALAAYQRGEPLVSPLRVTPVSSWLLTLSLTAIVFSALLLSVLCHIEITTEGRGIVRAAVQPLRVQTGGVVAEVLVQSGERVKAGQVIVRIESKEIEARLIEAKDRVALADDNLARLGSTTQALYRRGQKLLARREALVRRRIASQERSITRLESKEAHFSTLQRKGIVAEDSAQDVAESLDGATRSLFALQEQLRDTQLQLRTLDVDREAEVWRWTSEKQEAERAKEAAELLLEQTTVVAPASGQVEEMTVRRGDVVQAGIEIGKLVPEQEGLHAVAFVAERDRAFVVRGQRVRLEVDQLPAAEFGMLEGRVERVGADLVSQREAGAVFGETEKPLGPVFRVDVRLVDDAQTQRLAPQLRSGTMVTARLALRKRRIITLALDPLRKWLQ